jgi:hypothetical protein
VCAERPSSGDAIEAGSGTIEVYVRELDQFFYSFDPSPFHEKSLNPDAHEYIVSTAKELSGRAPTALVVYLSRPVGLPDEAKILRDAIRAYFARRAELMRAELTRVRRRELVNLGIGLTLLVTSVLTGELLVRHMGRGPLATVLRESLLIGGWVAMWRPVDFFLYELWARRNELRVYERLASVAVRIIYEETSVTRQGDEDKREERTIRLFDERTGRELGRISEAELKVLQDALEEEGPDDDDYWINPDVIDDIARCPGATPHLISLLRAAVGDNPDGIDIAFQRDGEARQSFRPARVARRPTTEAPR